MIIAVLSFLMSFTTFSLGAFAPVGTMPLFDLAAAAWMFVAVYAERSANLKSAK
jgi:hypothetical protein